MLVERKRHMDEHLKSFFFCFRGVRHVCRKIDQLVFYCGGVKLLTALEFFFTARSDVEV